MAHDRKELRFCPHRGLCSLCALSQLFREPLALLQNGGNRQSREENDHEVELQHLHFRDRIQADNSRDRPMAMHGAPYRDRGQCRGGGRGTEQPAVEGREQQERKGQKHVRQRYAKLEIAHRTDDPGKNIMDCPAA